MSRPYRRHGGQLADEQAGDHGAHRDTRTAAQRRTRRAVRDRVRERRLVDLLRARAGGVLRARADAGDLHAGGRPVRADRQDVRRRRIDVSGGRRLLVVRPPRVQRVRLVLRRLGAQPRLHPHDRDLGVLRAALPRRVLAGADAQPRGHHRRPDRDRRARLAEHPRDRRVGEAQLHARDPRSGHAGADHPARGVLGAEPVAAGQSGAPRFGSELEPHRVRAVAGDARLHRDRDRLEHGRGGDATRAATCPRP